MTDVRRRVATGSWAVAAGLLVVVTLVGRSSPDAVPDAPAFGGAAWWLGLAVVTAQAGLLLRQPSSPGVVLVAVAVGAPAAAASGLQSATGVTSVAVLVAALLATLAPGPARAWPALAAAAGLVALGELMQQLDTGAAAGPAVAGGLAQGLGTVGLPVLVGVVVGARRAAQAAREESTRALLREQAALVDVAVARERTAMARELHDIAAHHLTGIAVMAGALPSQIDSDPEAAKRAVGEVRRQSRAMLRDLRSLVGLLREDGAPPGDVTREESLSGIAVLVDTARRAGAEVSLVRHDRPDGTTVGEVVGPLAQLSAYRTVQEALANAARHAPRAAIEVTVDGRDASVVLVTVRNDPPSGPAAPDASRGGFGLVGMRERAELTGATLDVGATADGGWQVALRLPVSEEPA